MNNDIKTTVSGMVASLAAVVVLFFPKYSELITQIASGVAIIAGAIAFYFTNKPDPPAGA
jgi:uncharacterized membrane protein HdeD (DUF308 family)